MVPGSRNNTSSSCRAKDEDDATVGFQNLDLTRMKTIQTTTTTTNDANDNGSPKRSSSSQDNNNNNSNNNSSRGGEQQQKQKHQQEELLQLEEESGRRSKRASIDVGDDATTLERFRRIASQHQKQQQHQEQEHREQVEVLKEEEDEDKQQQVSDSAKFSERIKALLAQSRDEMNSNRDEDYDEAGDDMYNTCVYGEYEGGERDDEEEENDAIYETIVEEEENLSELSSKHSSGGRLRVATTKSDTREDLIRTKNEDALAKKKGIAFLSMKAAKEDDLKKGASAEAEKKKKKKKGFLTGIFSSKSKKSLSSASELREQEGEEEKVF